MGTEAASARRRVTRWLPAAAAPAFVGVAAAFALTSASGGATPGQATADRAALSTASRSAAVRAAGIKAASSTPSGSAATRLTSAAKSATRQAAKPAAAASSRTATATKYTVKPGDTLSEIAKRVYHDDRFWTAIYWANHRHLRYANQITAGQVLTVPAKPAKAPAAPKTLGPAPATVTTADVATGTAQQQSSSTTSTVSTSGDSAFQACVIQRESGGNAQVMNASGHYGLYQFSASTWAAYGGNPADFGHASVAEQNQVFDNAIAAGGQSNWSLYDGC